MHTGKYRVRGGETAGKFSKNLTAIKAKRVNPYGNYFPESLDPSQTKI